MYVNYIPHTEADVDFWARNYGGIETIQRALSIKAKYDPDNVFNSSTLGNLVGKI